MHTKHNNWVSLNVEKAKQIICHCKPFLISKCLKSIIKTCKYKIKSLQVCNSGQEFGKNTPLMVRSMRPY